MNKIAALLLLLIMVFSLCACGCRHEWIEATCTEPEICAKCGKIGGSPLGLGHIWTEATCTEPKTCSRCGATEGDPLGHSWTEQTETTPRICLVCGAMEPMPLPQNGQAFIGRDTPRGSQLTIKAADQSVYIKLKDAYGNDVFSFFVQANQTAVVEVPAGQLYVYFAYGDEWYGPEYCFGENTFYSKDDEALNLDTYTYTYTLYQVTDGNFSETPIDENEF